MSELLTRSIVQRGTLSNSLLTNISKMDYWADGIDSDGLSLNIKVGEGGALKQLACASISTC